jgi:hypothetical protein
VEFGELEDAIVARLQSISALSFARIQSWPSNANLEGLVVADASIFVRFHGLGMTLNQTQNRSTDVKNGALRLEIQTLCKKLRGGGSHEIFPSIYQAIADWPPPGLRIVAPPLYLAPQGFQLSTYELIEQDDWLWHWGAMFVANVNIQR